MKHDYEITLMMSTHAKKKEKKRWEWNLRIFLKHLYIYENDDPNSENVSVEQQNHK